VPGRVTSRVTTDIKRGKSRKAFVLLATYDFLI
jgi:hypothetical protein